MLDNVIKGKIDDWMWNKIIDRMYDLNDGEVIKENIRTIKAATLAQMQQAQSQQKRMTREQANNQAQPKRVQLMYVDFQKVILDFQLFEHERFLRKFTKYFKAVDRDTNGVLDENEFRELIQNMQVITSDQELDYLLQSVDPHNNNRMTYSEIVTLLSNYLVPRDDHNENLTIPLLEKFINLG